MKCPIDGATLTMTKRSAVELDYSRQCRGVWLDRGELDKILAQAETLVDLPEPREVLREPAQRSMGDGWRVVVSPRERQPSRTAHLDDRRSCGDRLDDDSHRKKRRKGFLGELFDF